MKVKPISSFFLKTGGSSSSSQREEEPEVVNVPSRVRKGGSSKKDEKSKKDEDNVLRGEASDEEGQDQDTGKKKERNGKKKKHVLSDDSDGEDPLPKSTRKKKTEGKSSTDRKRKAKVLIESDSDDDFVRKKTSPSSSKTVAKVPEKSVKDTKEDSAKEIKPKVNVNPVDFFSSEPIKRQKTEKVVSSTSTSKDKIKEETKKSEPEEDNSEIGESSSKIKNLPDKSSSSKAVDNTKRDKTLSQRTPTKSDVTSKLESPPRKKLEYESSSPPPSSRRTSPRKQVQEVKPKSKSPEKPKMVAKKEEFKAPTPKANEKSKKSTKRPKKKVEEDEDEDDFDPSSKPPPKKPKKTPVKSEKKVDASSIKTPEEKKKIQMQNFSKYKAKVDAKPKNFGLKEIPVGAPNCLAGLTFVITGVLDSLEREACKDLVEQYGGRVTSAVSGKTTYLIVGDDPGESKTRKAKELKIPEITEDGLLEMLTKSNPNPQPVEASIHFFDSDSEEEETKTSKISEAKKLESPKREKSVSSPEKPNSSTFQQESDKPKPTPASSSDPSAGLMWVDKYKPKTFKHVVGQGKDTSNAFKLVRWLRNWYKNHRGNEKAKAAWPGLKDPEGKTFKCALLSGPPGIGKTTTAHLACKEVGYDFYELNASDTRNKRGLKENVADALTNKCLFVGSNKEDQLTSHHVLVMDEVDGMSGNEDRGGVQELISLIKSSRIPIICICNDRNHQKIRSLANYCFDLRFNKPTIQELKGFVASICFKEQLKVDPVKLTQLMISTDQDVRQILHQLELFKGGNAEQVLNPKKDLRFGPWDVSRKVFSKSEHQQMSIHDKSGLFFQDYSLGPLFVQENYLKQTPALAKGNRYKTLDLISKSAAAIADGDLVDNIIRRTNNWSMLPVQAIYSSYIPGEYMASNSIGRNDFPQWLGKNSNKNKRHRLLQSLHTHVHLQVSGSLEALNMDYLPYLRRFIVDPLVKSDIESATEKMETYALLRDDLESINDLSLWPKMSNPMDKVDTKTKAAFTRAVNKEMLPYSNAKPIKSKSKTKTDEMGDFEDEEEEEEEEEEETVEKDAMIKMKKKKETSKASSSKTKAKKGDDEPAKPSTSKGKGGRSKK